MNIINTSENFHIKSNNITIQFKGSLPPEMLTRFRRLISFYMNTSTYNKFNFKFVKFYMKFSAIILCRLLLLKN